MKKKIIIVLSLVGLIIILGGIGTLVYFKTVFISEKEVKDIIVKDINVQEKELKYDSIDLELDKKYYEVELYYNNIEYEYKIDAIDGKIIYSNFNKSTNNTITKSNIVIDDAKKIALDDQKLQETDVVFTKIEADTENTLTVYEIEYQYNGYEYEYKINTIGGILSFKTEPVNK